MPLNHRFPPGARLRSAAEFEAVFAARHSRQGRALRAWWRENEGQGWRLGLSVSRKVGPAHRRNKVKRRLREIFRMHRAEWKGSRDLVLSAKPEAARLSYTELEADVLSLIGAMPREAPQNRRNERPRKPDKRSNSS